GGDERYYLSLVNINYYLEGGEPPGRYYGLGAQEFGLSGLVERKDLEALCLGYDPHTGRGVQNAGVFEGKKARTPGYDLTFSADKTVSAIWAVAKDELREAIQKKFDRAVKRALDFAQDRAGFSRIGKNGIELVFAPLLFAMFDHGTSRAGDPQLHR